MKFVLLRSGQFLRWLVYCHCAAVVTFVFIVHPGVDGYRRAMFGEMVDGTAHRPHVYRTLVPTGIRLLSSVTPDSLKERLIGLVKDTRLFSKLGWDVERIPEYVIATLVFFACFLGFAFALHNLVPIFYPEPTAARELGPIIGLIVLPVFFRYYNHVYDPATLFLFTACIFFLLNRSLVKYYLFFILMAINKETAILLVLVFSMWYWQKGKPIIPVAIHVCIQTILFLSIRAIIALGFANNPGGFMEDHLLYNIYLIVKPGAVLYIALVFAVFGYLVVNQWSLKPIFLRRGFVAVFVPLFALTLFFGNLDEPRIFYESFPFVFLLSLPTIMDALGIRIVIPT